MSVSFDNSYVRLPDRFFSRQLPVPVAKPGLIRINHELAALLGIDANWLSSDEGIGMITGNSVPEEADPIATVYAGHQFGAWNPQLGDGRAVLLGEVIGTDGERYDVQLKGSGQTPYSRMGDGRAPLGPVLREYIVSEAMFALGVPTTRSLAAASTGEPVYREETLPGAVLARVAKSHIRIGTVQFFAARSDTEALHLLIDHVINRHYPDLRDADNPALALLDEVMKRQADLVVKWQMLGFIHGVMNTDNMLLSGETVDYGPCAFMDTYHPETVYSSIDQGGRYAYRNQPGIAHWNLACLAQAIVPLLAEKEDTAIEMAKEALDRFPGYFLDRNIKGLRRKLGLSMQQDDDEQLASDFLALLETEKADFTLAFRRLAELSGDAPPVSVASTFDFTAPFDAWLNRWHARCEQEEYPLRQADMLATNPAFIPRNHLVEAAITAATDNDDLSVFNQLVDQLTDPWSLKDSETRYLRPPEPGQVVKQTFCGT